MQYITIKTYFGSSIFSIIVYILFVAGIILLAYLTTLYVAKFYNRSNRSKNIKILERVQLAADKSLWLIELDKKCYFIYADKNGMTKIDEVESEHLIFEDAEAKIAQSDFLKIFKQKIMNKDRNSE